MVIFDGRNRTIDGRQTRIDHGCRQQPVHRLGHRPVLPPAWRRTSLYLSRGCASQSGSTRWPPRRVPTSSFPAMSATTASIDQRLRRDRRALGHARFPGPCHRLLRQGPAVGPLSRNDGRQFHQDAGLSPATASPPSPSAPRRLMRGWRLDPHADLLRGRKMDAAL